MKDLSVESGSVEVDFLLADLFGLLLLSLTPDDPLLLLLLALLP